MKHITHALLKLSLFTFYKIVGTAPHHININPTHYHNWHRTAWKGNKLNFQFEFQNKWKRASLKSKYFSIDLIHLTSSSQWSWLLNLVGSQCPCVFYSVVHILGNKELTRFKILIQMQEVICLKWTKSRLEGKNSLTPRRESLT